MLKKNVPPTVWKTWIASELQAANRRFEKLKKRGAQVPNLSNRNKNINKDINKNMHIIEEEDSEYDSRRQSANLDY